MFLGSLFPCCIALLISVMACARSSNSAPSKVEGPGVTTANGLQYWDIKVGDGPGVSPGAKLTVQYTGWLENGQKFDSSLDRKQPFEFQLGIDPVIKGWARGDFDDEDRREASTQDFRPSSHMANGAPAM